ncbi:ABC transporter permease [Agromyces laixinhei]|uniref:ABC transporter permease n=1 Tax=Agromyces laixinhei TaxID=2585717 RepID=UPI0012EDFB8A|nr:ABC transporter permease [Agromyces laixinhei]
MNRLIRGEFTRFAATRLPLWTVLCAVGSGGAITGLLGFFDPEQATPPMPGLETSEGVAVVLGMNAMLLFVPALIGTIAVTSEYRHRTIGTTFLVAPRRGAVLSAKLLVYGLLGMVYGVLTSCTAALALMGAAAVRGVALGLESSDLVMLLARLAAAGAVYMVIGVAVGALAANQLVAVGIVLGYFYFLEPLLMIVPGVNAVHAFLPGGATSALMGSTYLADAIATELSGPAAPAVTAGLGAALLLAYAVIAAVAAIAVPLRRDLR